MTDKDIDKLKEEANKKIFEYVALLETTNDALLNTLKQCAKLLSEFTQAMPDNQGFKEIINDLNNAIKIGERVVIKKTLH